MPPHSASLRIRLKSSADAEAARRALEPENGPFLSALCDGATLVLEAKSGTALGLMRTLDDALDCLKATGLV